MQSALYKLEPEKNHYMTSCRTWALREGDHCQEEGDAILSQWTSRTNRLSPCLQFPWIFSSKVMASVTLCFLMSSKAPTAWRMQWGSSSFLGVTCPKGPGGKCSWKFSTFLLCPPIGVFPLWEPEHATPHGSEMQGWEDTFSHLVISGASSDPTPWFPGPCVFPAQDKALDWSLV